MHSGCRGEVAAAASCAEPKRLGVANNGKKYPVVETGQKCEEPTWPGCRTEPNLRC